VKIKVLVIDDSPAIRAILGAIVNEQPDMVVVGAAPDPVVARDMIRTLNPDVLTLDIEMPRMNGLSFLKRLMRARPMPVVMLSSHTQEGSDIAFRALALGAVDFVAKPSAGVPVDDDYACAIATAIRGAHAARDKIRQLDIVTAVEAEVALPSLGDGANQAQRVVVMGASTGGAEALREVLPSLPMDVPPVLVALHMPASFTRHFARRLDESCRVKVKEAEDGEPALPGHVYLAPGGRFMRLESHGTRGFGIAIGAEAAGARPFVDTLFHSTAEAAGAEGIGVILTGMGADGAEGLRAMRDRGAFTVAQDEASSIVFGMPRAAIEREAVQAVAPLGQIARLIVDRLSGARAG
jgi:two-component system chemotaxis response regulator CheB